MSERFYTSGSPSNKTFSIEMPTIGKDHQYQFRKNLHDHENLFQKGQKQLERSYSKQSAEMSKGKKSYSSKGNLRGRQFLQKDEQNEMRRKQSKKLIQQTNQKVIKQYQGVNRNSLEGKENITVRKFQFSIISFAAEVFLAYGITIGLMYLVKVSDFPFFLLLLVFGLMLSIEPWSKANIFVLLAWPIIIANYFLHIQILTYPSIIICYFSTMIFNEQYKKKILFIPILVITMVWGFLVIPAIYRQFFNNSNGGFYYVFPLFMFIIRFLIFAIYRKIAYTEYIFLQLPFFVLGLQFGVLMTLDVSNIQFWYLMVFFTLSIVNDRTLISVEMAQSVLKALTRFSKSNNHRNQRSIQKKSRSNHSNNQLNEALTQQQKKQLQPIIRNASILAGHASGYASINFLHIICITFVFIKLDIYSPPYTNETLLNIYILPSKVYIPLVIWGLGIIYEVMGLILERKRADKLLIGFVNNGIVHTIERGLMLTVGLWLFYLGFAIGSQLLLTN